MKIKFSRFLFVAAVISVLTSVSSAAAIPDPVVDSPRAGANGLHTAVLGGGCFWGLQALFDHVKGVTSVTAGYSGGSAETANYEAVSEGRSGHAEAVRITYEPSQITYGRRDLLPENWPRIIYDFGRLEEERGWPRENTARQRS